MSEWLQRLEVQTAIAPFAVAFCSYLLIQKWQPKFATLGLSLGFLVTVLLVNGWVFTPLTGTRKIILLSLSAGIIGSLLENEALQGRVRQIVFLILGSGSLLWSLSSVLSRQTTTELALLAGGGIIFIAWNLLNLDSQRRQSIRAGAAVMSLGFGAGACALLGGSALLGQLGLALGSAAGAFLLIASFSSLQSNSALTFIGGLTACLLAYAGLAFANLPWYSLIPLSLIPLVSRVPVPEALPRWIRAAAISLCCLAVAGSAVLLLMFFSESGASGY